MSQARSRSSVSAPLAASVALALACSVLAPPALADGGDKAAAESLFQEARGLMDQKRYPEACAKFTESLRLDPTLGTKLNLARCHESEGKIATAWAEYREVVVLARQAGQTERADAAEELSKKLEASLPKLKVEVPKATPGLVVKRDGTEVGAGSLGTALPVDPGEHTIVASAPGYTEWSTKVQVAADGGEKAVTVPALVAAPKEGPEKAGGSSALGTVGLAVGGAGVAALVAGGVLGGLTLADADKARSDPTLCPDNLCSPAGREVVNGAETKGLVSTILLAAGGVMAAGGVTLFLVGRSKAPEKTASAASGPRPPASRGRTPDLATLAVSPAAGGVLVRGVF